MNIDESSAIHDAEMETASGVDDSGTSSSSIVNAECSGYGDEEDTGSTETAGKKIAISFGILKGVEKNKDVEKEGDNVEEEEEEELKGDCGKGDGFSGSIVTRQLFPAAEWPMEPSTTMMTPAADLAGAGGVNWLETVVETKESQRQAKKSRRGPRSRSSQYRGVTFYRRTGRWESHIWSILSFLFLFSLPSS